MTFKDFFLLQERDDFNLAYTTYHLAKYWVENLISLLQKFRDLKDGESRSLYNLSIEYYEKSFDIHTNYHVIPIFIARSPENRKGVEGVAQTNKDWSPSSIFVYNEKLAKKRERFQAALKEYRINQNIREVNDSAEQFKYALLQSKTDLITVVGHELTHHYRLEKDIIGDKNDEAADEMINKMYINKGYRKNDEGKYVYDETKDVTLKKYKKAITDLYRKTRQVTPWYRFKKLLDLKDEWKFKLSQADFGTYANSFSEIDARFIDAIFPTLRKEYDSFEDLKNDFMNSIAADYWDHLLPKNKQRILKRLYQYYDSKK